MSGSTGEPALSRRFGASDIPIIRRVVAEFATQAGLAERERDDLVLVVDEILTNAVRHGGGAGWLELWVSGGRVHFRVIDDGPGMDTSKPFQVPAPTQGGGRGLWIAHQLSDDFMISSGPEGTLVAGAIGAVR